MGAQAIFSDDFLSFPEGFLWGVATSAFQVEGHPDEALHRLSDWSRWTVKRSKIADGTNADHACEFYQRYPDDIELCRAVNANCFRMSLNWALLRPKRTGAFSLDSCILAYYRNVLKTIKSKGMTTFVTLFHFCLPEWLAEIGGWNNPLTVSEFEQYARLVASELGDLVDFWLTLNEPLVYAYQGYVTGVWPPGHKRNYLLAFRTIRRMLEGHAAAYRAIHSQNPGARVSHVIHWRPFEARNRFNPLDLIVRYYRNRVFNHVFPSAIETGELQFPFPICDERLVREISGPIAGLKQSADFLAINYYTREICQFRKSWPPDIFGVQSELRRLETTGLDWEIYPEGLFYLLTEDIAPYKFDRRGNLREIYITENGMADEFSADLQDGDWSLNDDMRVRYMILHMVAIHRAIEQGANVKGYLYWSLTDNFEWSEGLTPRFGLFRVAYPSQERKMRKSAAVFAEVAARNGIGRQHLVESRL